MRHIHYACILLFCALHYAKGQPGESSRTSKASQKDEVLRLANVLGIDHNSPLKVARRGSIYYPQPPQGISLPWRTVQKQYCPFHGMSGGKTKTCLQEKPSVRKCDKTIRWRTFEMDNMECGVGTPQGKVYQFQYDFCGPEGREFENKEKTYAVLFSICYDGDLKQPIFTKHKIASYSYDLNKILEPANYNETLAKEFSIRGSKIDLQQIAQAYQDHMNQSSSSHSGGSDKLIPQTLLPETDFDPEYARGANLTYAVVRPQYESLSNYWNLLNQMIWEKYYTHETEATVYAGTALNLVFRNKEVIIQVSDADSITVPMIWWKGVETKDMKAIVLLYNIPKGDEGDSSIELLQKKCDTQPKSGRIQEFCRGVEQNLRGLNRNRYECCEWTDDVNNALGTVLFRNKPQ